MTRAQFIQTCNLKKINSMFSILWVTQILDSSSSHHLQPDSTYLLFVYLNISLSLFRKRVKTSLRQLHVKTVNIYALSSRVGPLYTFSKIWYISVPSRHYSLRLNQTTDGVTVAADPDLALEYWPVSKCLRFTSMPAHCSTVFVYTGSQPRAKQHQSSD